MPLAMLGYRSGPRTGSIPSKPESLNFSSEFAPNMCNILHACEFFSF